MAIYEFDGTRAVIGRGALVPGTADVIGDLVTGEDCVIGVASPRAKGLLTDDGGTR